MVRDISKGRYLLRWHTHRLVTKTQNHSPYLLIGVFFSFFFDFSDLKCEQTGETPLCGCHSPINVRNKQNIKKMHQVVLSF